MTRLALIFALLCTSIVSLCQNYGTPIADATTRLQQLKAANANISTISANFTTTTVTPLLVAPQHGAGLLTYSKSADRLALNYTQPQGDAMIIEHGTISITSAGKTITSGGGSTEHLLSIFRACLTGNFDQLTQKSDVEYYQSATLFSIVIRPRNARIKKFVKQMTLRFDNSNTLSFMRIDAGNGESTEYEYTNQIITRNTDIQ